MTLGAEEYAEFRVVGGSGDPLERPVEAVHRDLDAGYVTAEGARRDYGWVVGEDGMIDRAARLRTGLHRAAAGAGGPAGPETVAGPRQALESGPVGAGWISNDAFG